MPLNVTMQQPDWDKFIDAMAWELSQHTKWKHWKIIHKSHVPKTAKRDSAGVILKWKAHLCAGGHRQVSCDAYWTTFAPVVLWTTVQCIFIMTLLLGWHMRLIDFVMAYTQADVKTNIFMQLPAGTTIKEVDPNKHLSKLQKNLYCWMIWIIINLNRVPARIKRLRRPLNEIFGIKQVRQTSASESEINSLFYYYLSIFYILE